MMRSMGALIFAGVLASQPIAQAGDRCDNVKINVKNQYVTYDDPDVADDLAIRIRNGGMVYAAFVTAVEVLRAEYFDFNESTWRTEALKNKVILPGESESWTEHLELVDEDSTVVRVVYRHQLGAKTYWGKEQTSSSSEKFRCHDDASTVNLILNESFPK